MTTIVTDGRTMAADGRVTQDCRILTNACQKIFRTDDGQLIGIAGATKDVAEFLVWYKDGEVDVLDVDEDFQALVLDSDGCVYQYDKYGSRELVIIPAAIGTGGDIALGVILAGESPEAAVHIAMLRDCFTGGTVQVEKRLS